MPEDDAMPSLVDAGWRTLGFGDDDDLEVGPLAFGCWRFVGTDVAKGQALVEAALDLGMDLVDTADIYGRGWGGGGFGESEELLGKVLAAAPELRDRMVLATKGGIREGVPYDSSARLPGAGVRRLAAPARRRRDRPLPGAPPGSVRPPARCRRGARWPGGGGQGPHRRRLQPHARSGRGARRVPGGAARLHSARILRRPPRAPARRHPRSGHGPGLRRAGLEPARRRPPRRVGDVDRRQHPPELVAILDELAAREKASTAATIALAFVLALPFRPVGPRRHPRHPAVPSGSARRSGPRGPPRPRRLLPHRRRPPKAVALP